MSKPTRRLPNDDEPSGNTQGEGNHASDNAEAASRDAAEQRRKKLAAIKKAVDAGEYDSEDVLDDALKSMLRHLDDE